MTENITKNTFADDFIWGVATSAFQIEGAKDADGKGLSIWDTFCEQEGVISDNSDGSVACNHYNRLESDLDMIAGLGVNAYRFSISWPRVQPLGEGAWNEEGFAFYSKLIDGLEARGITAHLTLYHWDLPQALHEKGGWAERDICQHFTHYAQEVGRRFGNRVQTITTHNEPWVVAILGYEHGIFAPGIKDRAIAMQVSHNLLLSHGMAVQKLRSLDISAQFGIVLNQSPIYPATEHEEDVKKARLDDGLVVRWYMDALLKCSYPQDIVEFLGADAPIIESGDMELICQPLDFIGINYYTRNFSDHQNPWDAENEGLEVTDMGWEIYPQGITELLCRLNTDYKLPKILITENGAAFKDKLEGDEVKDTNRVSYFEQHITAVKAAIDSGVDVGGYFAWSLMDNFEWASGYSKRFGLIYVDYETQKRYPKDSAKWYSNFIKR